MLHRILDEIARTGTSHDPAVLKRVLLAKEDGIPGVLQLAVSELQPGQRVLPHAHVDLWEIFLVRKGSMTLEVDGQEQVLGVGHMAVVPPPCSHGVACRGDTTLELLVLGVRGDPPLDDDESARTA
jgi:quercetin dioxygenase-like cupin family protein